MFFRRFWYFRVAFERSELKSKFIFFMAFICDFHNKWLIIFRVSNTVSFCKHLFWNWIRKIPHPFKYLWLFTKFNAHDIIMLIPIFCYSCWENWHEYSIEFTELAWKLVFWLGIWYEKIKTVALTIIVFIWGFWTTFTIRIIKGSTSCSFCDGLASFPKWFHFV